jgi:hypothetical protein
MMLHRGNARQFLFEMPTIMLTNNCANGVGNRARLVHARKCSTIAKYAKRFPGASVRRFPDAGAAYAARRRIAHWSFACLLALFAALALLPQYGLAEQGTGGASLERRVKAAFLYKFLGYTEFPPGAFADAASPVTIAVAGSDEMAAELSAITLGRTVNNRPITVRSVHEGESGPPAHLLFVAGPDCARAGRVIRSVRALLVVTECDNGLQQGAVINFRIVDEHVRFDVSLDAAEKNNVKLSSRLLTVANRVQRGAQ